MINHQKLPLTDEKRRLILVSIVRIDYPEEVERIKAYNETKMNMNCIPHKKF